MTPVAPGSSRVTNRSPSGAVPWPSWVSATPVRPSCRRSVGSIGDAPVVTVLCAPTVYQYLRHSLQRGVARPAGDGDASLPPLVAAARLREADRSASRSERRARHRGMYLAL